MGIREVAAILVGGLLVWGVVSLGARPLPAELSPLKPTWDFTGTTSPWRSRNGHLARTPEGLMVNPTAGNAAMISSGQLDHDPAAFERMHVRLKVGDATQGRVGLVLSGSDGSSRVLVPFDVPGGGTFADIEVSLPTTGRTDVRVVEVVLVPSLAVQPSVVASIAFRPSGPWLAAAVRELWSRAPGEITALSGFSMHTLPPPVINGRSIWVVLIPVVVAGLLAHHAGGTSEVRRVVRRSAWGLVGTVWAIGFLFMLYHQLIALGVDMQRFGDRSREEAYHLVDAVPLWDDISEVARWLAPGSTVEFKTAPAEDPVVSAFWQWRAAYYLYPVLVRVPAPVRVLYFGGPHPPCVQIAANATVLQEAARYCLFKVGA